MSDSRIERLEAVFHEVMGAPPAEREGVIARLTQGDEALAAEVRSLVEAAGTDDLLARLDTLAESVESSLEHVPERLGRYRVIRAIGEGGWGRVFEAEQDEPLIRRVAVKILHPGMNSRSVLQRFRRELGVLARMEHASIAKVFDAGLTEQGLPYIVMEFINGLRIDAFCEENALDLRERVGLLAGVCEAVQHAHTKGIVHRDLKPSNILVVEGEEGPRPVVIDFGIAKALTEDTHGQTTTAGHLHPGTPEYMSPEQASDGGAEIDARTDIYSLGVVLYRLVTGVLPFTAERSAQESGGDLLRLIREHESPPPSVVARTKGERLPREIDWIVRRCLAKRPEDRYETVAALRADLQRFVRREPLEAGPPTARYRVRSFVRRHPLGVIVAGSLLMALTVGGGLAAWGFVEANQAWRAEARRAAEAETAWAAEAERATEAEAAWAAEAERAAETETIAGFFEGLLREMDIGQAGGDQRKAFVSLMTQGVEYLDDHHGLSPGAQLRLRRTMANTLHHLQEFDASADQWRQVVTLASSIHGERSREAVDMRFAWWNTLISGNGYDEIIDTAYEQIAAAGEIYGEQSREQLRARQNYGLALERRGRFGEAEAVYRSLITDSESEYGPNDPGTTGAMANLAVTLSLDGTGRGKEAYEIREEAYRRMCETLPETSHQRSLTRLNLTGYLVELGRYEEAESEARAVLTLWLSQRGDDDRWVWSAYKTLAEIYEASGDVDGAIAVYQELLDRQAIRMANGQSTTQLADTRRGVVDLLMRSRRKAEAQQLAAEWGMEWALDPP